MLSLFAFIIIFFLVNSYITASVHALTGLTTSHVLTSFAVSAPFVLAGTMAGSICYGLLPHRVYIKIIFSFLVIMGLIMMFTA